MSFLSATFDDATTFSVAFSVFLDSLFDCLTFARSYLGDMMIVYRDSDDM